MQAAARQMVVESRIPVFLEKKADPGSRRLVTLVIATCFVFTAVALYSLHLNQRLDSLFYEIDAAKVQNQAIQRDIEALEFQVNALRSYGRVESVLRDAGLSLSVPTTVFYLDVERARGKFARRQRPQTVKETI